MLLSNTLMPALAVQQLRFSFCLPHDWNKDLLQVGFRIRGSLGLALKQGCCFFDAKKTSCVGCLKRPHCHYGQSFETMQSMEIEGLGQVGSMPHAWGLSLQQKGIYTHGSIALAGMELAHLPSWKAAVERLPLAISLLPMQWYQEPFLPYWQSLTPVRLRLKGKNPRNTDELASALCHSLVNKVRMLAAWHGITPPSERLPEPKCIEMTWCDTDRFSFRTGKPQSLSGFLVDIVWPDFTPESWKPWLQLLLALGVGRQSAFGLGRFSCRTEKSSSVLIDNKLKINR